MSLTQRVVEVARNQGADLVGIASADRFGNFPEGYKPQDLLPDVRSVVVAAVRVHDTAMERFGKPTHSPFRMYGHGLLNVVVLPLLAHHLVDYLEDRGYQALPMPPANIFENQLELKAELSLKHTAVAAGLGEIGWNTLLITPQYGPRVRLVAVMTDAELEPSPVYGGPSLCEQYCPGAKACVEACPVKAYNESDAVEIAVAGREMKIGSIDKWRCAWCYRGLMKASGAPTDLPLPEKVTPEVFLQGQAKRNPWQNRIQGPFAPAFCSRCQMECTAGVILARERRAALRKEARE